MNVYNDNFNINNLNCSLCNQREKVDPEVFFKLKPNLLPTSYPQLKRTIEMERTMTQSRVYPLTSRRSFQIDCCFMLRIERI